MDSSTSALTSFVSILIALASCKRVLFVGHGKCTRCHVRDGSVLKRSSEISFWIALSTLHCHEGHGLLKCIFSLSRQCLKVRKSMLQPEFEAEVIKLV